LGRTARGSSPHNNHAEDASAKPGETGLSLRSSVVASVRHEDTEYDSLLMSGVSRGDARDRIRAAVDRILAAWAPPA